MSKPAKSPSAPPQGRRYVGTRETVAYIMFDMSASMNLNGLEDNFTQQILGLSNEVKSRLSWVIGAWDIVNDLLFASLVDATRTRFGKFRPYLTFSLLVGMPITFFFYFMPFLFHTPDEIKWSYLFFKVLADTSGTFNSISRTGMIATITPDPYDRLRLINIAEYLSSNLGEQLPIQLLTFLMQFVGHSGGADGILARSKLFLGFGTATAVLSGVFALYFALVSRERVPQSVEKPKILENFKALATNRPLLLLTLANMLSGINIDAGGENDYYMAVLNQPALKLAIGIPGFFTGQLGVLSVRWARRTFSTRFLWIFTSHFLHATGILAYLIGRIPAGKGDRPDLLFNWKVMAAVLGIREAAFSPVLYVRQIVNADMQLECMDYGEWKNGFRSEGMTASVREIFGKIVRLVFTPLSLKLKDVMGVGLKENYLRQSLRASRFIFGLFVLFPAVTSGLLGLIPKLFYNISAEDRERMYQELAQRRQLAALSLTETGADKDPA
ncbi:MAG: MFS transporter [Oscillospiraceae bacterium]|nr:MFS transporter [Oscillospiraceae bacterium]